MLSEYKIRDDEVRDCKRKGFSYGCYVRVWKVGTRYFLLLVEKSDVYGSKSNGAGRV